MRANLLILSVKAFNKQSSCLKVKCLEIPHYAYSSRCVGFLKMQYEKIIIIINIPYSDNKYF